MTLAKNNWITSPTSENYVASTSIYKWGDHIVASCAETKWRVTYFDASCARTDANVVTTNLTAQEAVNLVEIWLKSPPYIWHSK